jgi:outer membrane protein
MHLPRSRQDEESQRASSAQKALDDTETEVVSAVHSAWLDASTALKNISVAESFAASSAQALALAEAQYRAGQTSIIELSQAQLSDTQAEIAAAAAKYDYEILRAALDFQVAARITPATETDNIFSGQWETQKTQR